MSIKQNALIVLQVSIYLLLLIALICFTIASDNKVNFGIIIGIIYVTAIDVVKWIFK